MLADFVRLITRRPPDDYDRGFVRSVKVTAKSARNRKVERTLGLGWIVIVGKSVGVYWLFNHYHIPVNPLWVVAPTVFFAALCTALYLLRD